MKMAEPQHSPVAAGSGGETRGFFANARGRSLYHCLHSADAASGRGWVFCNPFLEEKVFSQPAYVALARRFASRGEPVLRFDYEGDGDSEGWVGEVGIAEWLADIETAAAELRRRTGIRVLGLFGLRLGATLAAVAAARVHADRLLLWEPVISGETYFQDSLRANLTTQLATYTKVVETREQMMEKLAAGGTVNLLGHEIGGRMAQEVSALELASPLREAACPAAIVHLRRSEKTPLPPALSKLTEIPGVRLTAVETTPFWGESRDYDPVPARLLDLSLDLATSEVA